MTPAARLGAFAAGLAIAFAAAFGAGVTFGPDADDQPRSEQQPAPAHSTGEHQGPEESE